MLTNRLIGKTTLITGATSGIGAETARQLAAIGVNLILTGRRHSRLIDLQKELLAIYPELSIRVHAFDITDRDECLKFREEYIGLEPDVLINNAGLAAGFDKVQSASLDDWDQMIDTNVRSLFTMTKLFLPAMIQRNSGHIINISSVAGVEPYSGGSVYCATKHAVHAFTKTLKMDVGGTNIRVSLVSPGAVNTEFSTVRFKGDKHRADGVYAGIKPLLAEDIAEIIVFVMNRPDHVNIMDTLVYPVAQSSATHIIRE